MDLPAPAPMHCNVVEVACEQEKVGPLLSLAFSDADKDNPSIRAVAVFERMDSDNPITIAGWLIPANSDATREALAALSKETEVVAQWAVDETPFCSPQQPVQLAKADLAVFRDDTFLPPAASLLKMTFKTGRVDQRLCFAFVADPKSV